MFRAGVGKKERFGAILAICQPGTVKLILIIEFIYNYNLACSLYYNLWRVFSNEINVVE